MNKIILIAVVVVSAIGSATASYMALDRPTSILEITPGSYDFGEVVQGEILSKDISIRNVSDQAIRITRVIASCSCSKADVLRHSLRPGESTSLELEWSTEERRGKVDLSLNLVVAEENRPGLKHFSVELSADVVPDYVTDVDRMTFNRGNKEHQEQLITLSPGPGRKSIAILKAYSSHKSLGVSHVEHDGLHRLTVRFSPESGPSQPIVADLVIETNSEKDPILRIPVALQ